MRQDLQTNYALLDCLREAPARPEGPLCSRHRQIVDVFCTDCKVMCCRECYNTSTAPHAQHRRYSLSEAVNRIPQMIREKRRGIEDRSIALTKVVNTIDEKIQYHEQRNEAAYQQSMDHFQRAIAELERQHQLLKSALAKNVESFQSHMLQEKVKWTGYQSTLQQLDEQFNTLQQASSSQLPCTSTLEKCVQLSSTLDSFYNAAHEQPVMDLLQSVQGVSLDNVMQNVAPQSSDKMKIPKIKMAEIPLLVDIEWHEIPNDRTPASKPHPKKRRTSYVFERATSSNEWAMRTSREIPSSDDEAI